MQKTLTTVIQLSKNKYIEKETGYLICENATLGSTGMQEYFAGDLGIEDLAPNVRVKVYRPAEEVFKPESLASLENKAFTVYHPDEMVNSSNDSRLRKGSVYNVHRAGDVIVGNIQITDQDTIEKAKHIRCLSLGYNLDLDKMDDAENSYIARNIRYNHLALVPKGRSKVAQINDSDQEFMEEEYMSLFHRNVKVSDAEEEETKAEDVEENKDVEETNNETETAKDECSEEVKDECTNEVATDEEDKTEEVAKDNDIEEKDEVAKDNEIEEVHDEDDKEEEKVDVGDTDTTETTEKVEEEKEEEKKEIKDGGEMTLEEIDKLTDADVRKIALAEYKAKTMADKGLVYGDENEGFKKPVEEPKPAAMDAEVERKLYYKNILNPHKNPNWKNECVNATDIDL